MKTPKLYQRLLAMVLCCAMLLPLAPVWASAAGPKMDTIPGTAISVPEYSGGTMSEFVEYDCGNGLKGDGSKSYLAVVTGTTPDEFQSYVDILKDAYDTKEWKMASNRSPNTGVTVTTDNHFATCSINGVKLYTYYLPAYQEARIIVDTQADTAAGYQYTPGSPVTTPKLVMWELSTSSSGYHIDTTVAGANTGRENNGVLLIMRMKDNSLFFYDGGILAQMSDAESAELLAFCRELTGIPAGQKMVINTWFVSHAHDDHFQAFGRFININHNHFDLKNVVYNIDLERDDVKELGGGGITPASKDLTEALDVIKAHYPNVKYYKPHTGETFDVAGIKFDVLYTHEDRLVPDSSGNLSFEEDKLNTENNIDILDIGGTYREGLYKNSETKQSDFNDTSTVLRVRFENGVSSILYADLNLAESIVEAVHSAETLKTDIMLVPHHLFDDH